LLLLPPALSHSAATTAATFDPGELAPRLDYADVSGRHADLSSPKGSVGAVLVTFDPECPVSQRYFTRIVELAHAYKKKGFDFAIVDVGSHQLKRARTLAANAPDIRWVLDDHATIASSLRAESTAEAFVIDSRGTLRYRGAIDDQYGLSYQRASVSTPYLRDALDAIIRGEEPKHARTAAFGCVLESSTAKPTIDKGITYHNRISRILQRHCQVCHRTGGLAPMPLETYRQVYDRRAIIDYMVGEGRMPPWSAKKGIGEWRNDRSLSDKEKADLRGWIRAGAPEGPVDEAPLPVRFAAGWNIGKPDAIVKIPEAIAIPAQGPVAYKYVFVKTSFDEDKWVTAVEIRPTQPQLVHHAVVITEAPGAKKPQDAVMGFFAVTVPGSLGITYPLGTGKKLPKGAWLKFEIHYQPNGREALDRTEVGFRFSAGPLREVKSLSAFYSDFVIPPYAPAFMQSATYRFEKAGQLVSLFPHMHLRGRSFRYDLRLPDGTITPLLDVPRFDFNWQSYYEFRTLLNVPAGSTLIATATYDNSKNNPWNPDPSREVRWGQQTYEEMLIGYFDFIEKSSPPKPRPTASEGPVSRDPG
jgi:hypothetical protein